MIAKCIAILAIVAQISASGCNQETIVLPSVGSSCQAGRISVVSSGSNPVTISSGVETRNVVAKGKYPVALRNCGPVPDRQIPLTTSTSTAPTLVKPTIRLASNIPAPRTIAHSCTCYKTIVRPRVHQQLVTVPSIQRYIETTHRPVVENIQYEAVPVNCEGSSGSSGSGVELITGSQEIVIPSQNQQVQIVEGQSPRVEVVEAQRVQAPRVEIIESQSPRVQIVEAQRVQSPRVEIVEAQSPRLQIVESQSPRVEVVEAQSPRVQFVEAPRVEIVEAQRVQSPRVEIVEAQRVQSPRVQIVESQSPRVEVVEAQSPRVQFVEAPRVEIVEAQRVQSPRVEIIEAQSPRVQIPSFTFGSSCQ